MSVFARISRLFGRRTKAESPSNSHASWWPFNSTAGEDVTPESALALSAYYACLRNASEDIAKLPVDVIRKTGKRRDPVDDHWVEWLFNVGPNDEMDALAFRETMTHFALAWGGAFAEIDRNGIGQPIALWPLYPSQVTILRDENKQLFYRVTTSEGPQADIYPTNMFHLHGLGDTGIGGYTIAQIGAESLGRGLAVQKFGGAFFGNGATFGVTVEYPGKLTPEARKNIQTSIKEGHASAGNAFKTFVFGDGSKLSNATLGIPPEDAQLIETSEFSVEDICRWFRMPPHKIGHYKRAQGWSTLEATNQDYVTDTLMAWAVRWEQQIRRKLFMLTETSLLARHNFEALLRGDSKTRVAFYKDMQGMGAINRNDIREKEDLNPVPGGDVYFIASNNLTPLGDDGLPIAPEPPPAPSGTEPEPPEDPEEPPSKQEPTNGESRQNRARSAAYAAFADAFARACRKETKACQAAARKHIARGDPDSFGAWVPEWCEQFESDMLAMVGPTLRVLLTLGGEDFAADQLIAEFCRDHCSETRGQLLGVLRDEGSAGVVERIKTWETGRELPERYRSNGHATATR